MFDGLLAPLTFLTALACGVMAGVFFAFSSFVMGGLAQLSPAHGMTAMQAINVAALRPPFMAAFFGSTAACVLLAVGSMWTWHLPGARYRLVGSLVYLLGTFVVTAAFNVPRNEALAGATADSADATGRWTRYLVEWTAWNHVRTVAAVVAAGLLCVALLELVRSRVA